MIKQEVTNSRHIKLPVQLMLWGKSAGRCQFEGCNKRLWENGVTKEQVNISQKAHIWAFSSNGPRGNEGIDEEHINDLRNLMLACHECHKLIDEDKEGKKYSVPLLLKMKKDHEERINLAASITPNKKSHILLYGANIGEHTSPVNYKAATEAIFPDHYPAEHYALELGLVRSPIKDHDDGYWFFEKQTLEKNFNNTVRNRLVDGDIRHLSVFGLAPQPLLVFLGKLLSDIPEAQVYQRHREPQTWRWQRNDLITQFDVIEPDHIQPLVALNISLSATIDNSRIEQVLGENTSIWKLTIPQPHNDFMRSASQLQQFRNEFRTLMDKIKSKHGHDTTLHIFPAVPISVAIEIGRTWMPKADMAMVLYDEIKERNGFVKAFNL